MATREEIIDRQRDDARLRATLKRIHAANPSVDSGAMAFGVHPTDWVTAGAAYKRRGLVSALIGLRHYGIRYRCRRHGKTIYISVMARDRELAARIISECVQRARAKYTADQPETESTTDDGLPSTTIMMRLSRDTFAGEGFAAGALCGLVVAAIVAAVGIPVALFGGAYIVLLGGMGFVVGMSRRRSRCRN